MKITDAMKPIAAVALAVGLVVSGCSTENPVAARVNGAEIRKADVDLLTRLECEARSSNELAGTPSEPISRLRPQSLGTLIQMEIDDQIVDALEPGMDGASFRETMDALEGAAELLDPAVRDDFMALLERFHRLNHQMYALAQQEAAAMGVEDPQPEQLNEMIELLRSDFRGASTITTDPSYGLNATATDVADPSLSLPVSDFAQQAKAQQPDASWVTSLPQSQRCD